EEAGRKGHRNLSAERPEVWPLKIPLSGQRALPHIIRGPELPIWRRAKMAAPKFRGGLLAAWERGALRRERKKPLPGRDGLSWMLPEEEAALLPESRGLK